MWPFLYTAEFSLIVPSQSTVSLAILCAINQSICEQHIQLFTLEIHGMWGQLACDTDM